MRGTLSTATFLTLFLFFLMSCGSKDSNKDLITNLALAQILAGSTAARRERRNLDFPTRMLYSPLVPQTFNNLERCLLRPDFLRIYRETILKITAMVPVTVLRIIL